MASRKILALFLPFPDFMIPVKKDIETDRYLNERFSIFEESVDEIIQ